jgi:hypothetical protein
VPDLWWPAVSRGRSAEAEGLRFEFVEAGGSRVSTPLGKVARDVRLAWDDAADVGLAVYRGQDDTWAGLVASDGWRFPRLQEVKGQVPVAIALVGPERWRAATIDLTPPSAPWTWTSWTITRDQWRTWTVAPDRDAHGVIQHRPIPPDTYAAVMLDYDVAADAPVWAMAGQGYVLSGVKFSFEIHRGDIVAGHEWSDFGPLRAIAGNKVTGEVFECFRPIVSGLPVGLDELGRMVGPGPAGGAPKRVVEPSEWVPFVEEVLIPALPTPVAKRTVAPWARGAHISTSIGNAVMAVLPSVAQVRACQYPVIAVADEPGWNALMADDECRGRVLALGHHLFAPVSVADLEAAVATNDRLAAPYGKGGEFFLDLHHVPDELLDAAARLLDPRWHRLSSLMNLQYGEHWDLMFFKRCYGETKRHVERGVVPAFSFSYTTGQTAGGPSREWPEIGYADERFLRVQDVFDVPAVKYFEYGRADEIQQMRERIVASAVAEAVRTDRPVDGDGGGGDWEGEMTQEQRLLEKFFGHLVVEGRVPAAQPGDAPMVSGPSWRHYYQRIVEVVGWFQHEIGRKPTDAEFLIIHNSRFCKQPNDPDDSERVPGHQGADGPKWSEAECREWIRLRPAQA